MSIVDANGNILTKAELLAKTTAVVVPDKVRTTEAIYETFTHPGASDHEGGRRLLYREGMAVSSAEIDAMYAASAASFSSITPATGLAAGGTNVTILGAGFSGVEGVTLGGVAATNVKVVSDTKITCTTGAHAAGAVAVVIQDASGNVTAAGAFTYA